MLRTKKYFDRGDFVLEVDTTSGKRQTRMIPKISPEQAQFRTLPGGDLKVVKKVGGQQRKKKTSPGMARRALNYGKAAVKHAVKGRPKVGLDVIQQRLAICRNCPSGKYKKLAGKQIYHTLRNLDVEVGQCTDMSCGCYLHETETEPNKLRWADQACPQGHWPAVEPEQK